MMSTDSALGSAGQTMRFTIHDIQASPALQQPAWDDPDAVRRVRDTLAGESSLVSTEEAAQLRGLLAEVAAGRARLVQAGDCAEDPAESTAHQVGRKVELLDRLAETAQDVLGGPVLRIGRIAGQFAKPRSKPMEDIGGVTVPAFRGHMVNGPKLADRCLDPERILTCYRAAQNALHELRALNQGRPEAERVWISHEALLLDYEIPLLRFDGEDGPLLGSAHLPWVGERTRDPDGAHVRMLSAISNPVAAKIGSGTRVKDIVALAGLLDPERQPGRLVVIARMGDGFVAGRLPPLVEAVRVAGHPVIWLCDPMHGNTITSPDGFKTRLLDAMTSEIQDFSAALAKAGGVNGGLHLETTPDDVTECAADASELGSVGERHTTFCDPRLNPEQAAQLVSVWARTL